MPARHPAFAEAVKDESVHTNALLLATGGRGAQRALEPQRARLHLPTGRLRLEPGIGFSPDLDPDEPLDPATSVELAVPAGDYRLTRYWLREGLGHADELLVLGPVNDLVVLFHDHKVTSIDCLPHYMETIENAVRAEGRNPKYTDSLAQIRDAFDDRHEWDKWDHPWHNLVEGE